MLEKLKGGFKNMARNLVRQKEIENPEEQNKKDNEKNIIAQEQNPEVRIITFETLIANNIDALNAKMDALHSTMVEAFKQVGVKFPEK